MSQFSNLLNLIAATSPEAEAAGLATIMKRLGVGLEEAKRIKSAAVAKQSAGLSEENIRALNKVRDYKAGKLAEMGRGADAVVYDAGDQVLKVPRSNRMPDDVLSGDGYGEKILADLVSPHTIGQYGVPSKNIQTSSDLYQVQQKVRTPGGLRPGSDPVFSDLSKKQDSLYNQMEKSAKEINPDLRPYTIEDIFNNAPYKDVDEYKKLEEAMTKRRMDMWREKGVDPDQIAADFQDLPQHEQDYLLRNHAINPDELKEYPMDTLAAITEYKAGLDTNAVRPFDVHSGNIGFDDAGNVKIFDTSRFKDLDTSALSEEEKMKVLQDYIASPDKKQQFRQLLEPAQSNIKKAAAVAPMATMSQEEDAGILDNTKEAVLSGLASAASSPTAQGTMDLLSIPGALGRTTINAVTENRAPSYNELEKAFAFPTSQENEDLATQATERIIPDADKVKSRTALDTLLKFM